MGMQLWSLVHFSGGFGAWSILVYDCIAHDGLRR